MYGSKKEVFTLLALLSVGVAGLCGSFVKAASVSVFDGTFSNPDLGTNGYGYGNQDVKSINGSAPTFAPPPGIAFAGLSGIASEGSPFDSAGVTADGQFGFLQNYFGEDSTLASITTSFTPTTNGAFDISFDAATRPNYSADPFTVSLDGKTFGNPITPGTGAFSTFTVAAGELTGGTPYTLTFTGTSTTASDQTSFIDSVAYSAVPLPPAVLAGGALFALCGIWMWRQQRLQTVVS